MNIKKLHCSLDSEITLDEKRNRIVSFLKSYVENLPDDDEHKRIIAYDIASLMSTKYALSSDNNDAIGDILALAGELEVPDQSNDNKWSVLIDLVRDLQ